jgi:hypothetical protein
MCCISCIHSSLGLLVIKHCFVLMKLKVVTIRGHGAGPSSVLETISQGSFSKFVARNHGTDPLKSQEFSVLLCRCLVNAHAQSALDCSSTVTIMKNTYFIFISS